MPPQASCVKTSRRGASVIPRTRDATITNGTSLDISQVQQNISHNLNEDIIIAAIQDEIVKIQDCGEVEG